MNWLLGKNSFFASGIRAALVTATLCLFTVELVADENDSTRSQAEKQIPAKLRNLTQQSVPLNLQKTLFLDLKEKCLYLQGTVVLNAGLLEMLCCKVQSKEHESIISVNCKAYPIHAGLLALKAKPGSPVSFEPEYQAPSGEKIEITVFHVNDQGKLEQQDVRKWVRTVTRRYFIAELANLPEGLVIPDDSEMKYDRRRNELLHFGTLDAKELKRLLALSQEKDYRKALETIHKQSQPQLLDADWVFAGSIFQKDNQTGEQRYLAEMGDYICVANFRSAMIDIAMPSSASDADRGFEANSDLVPLPGTPVILKLQRSVDLKRVK